MDPSSHPGFFSTVVENSVYCWGVIDESITITYISPASEQLFGFRPAELVGTSALDLLHPDYRDVAVATLADLLAHPGEGVPVVMGIRHADGSVVHVEVGGVVHLEDPHIQGIVIRLRPYDDQFLLEQYLEALATSVPVEQTLQPLVGSIKAQHLASEVALAYDWDGTSFASVVHSGLPPELAGLADPGPDHLAPWLTAIRSGRPATAATRADLPPDLAAAAERAGLEACWVFPVPVPPDAALLACLIVWRSLPGEPMLGHYAALEHSVWLAALGFERRHSEDLLRHAATHDTLTGIPNRSHFFDELDGLLAGEDRCERVAAVLYADLDGFKEVNDTHGHGVGDAVLVVVARRLEAALRPGDIVARVGGDEFAVLCRDLNEPDDATRVAERLIDAVRPPISVEGVTVRVGLSVGIAFDVPGEGPHRRLVDAADQALYRAKEAGKGRWVVADRP